MLSAPPRPSPLTADYAGTSKNPLVWKDRVYFLSDRDGHMNIWSMDLKGGGLSQHTFHKGFDASSPSLDAGRIAYQLVADIRVYDIAANTDAALAVTLPSDFDQMREKWVTKPLDYLTSGHVSPSGDRIVLVSRGHVFVAPVGDGRWVRVSRKEGVRARAARFMGDGKSLMVLDDSTGEWEFHRFAADGLGPSEQMTAGAKVIRFDGIPSPDGKWLAFADKDNQLWLYDVAKKALTRIGVSDVGMFGDLAWSPDSRWLAYVQGASNGFSRIVLLEAETGRTAELTTDRVDSYNPAWSPDGKWLYFLSDRWFRSAVGSPWGPRQPEPYFDKTTKIYAAGLSGKDPFPFAPATELEANKKESGEEKPAEAKAEADRREGGQGAGEAGPRGQRSPSSSPASRRASSRSRSRPASTPAWPPATRPCSSSTRARTPQASPSSRPSRSGTATSRPRRSWRMSAISSSRPTARSSWSARAATSTSSTPGRPSRPRRRSPSAASTFPSGPSPSTRARSGARCSSTPGAWSATTSTTATSTTSTTRACSSGTGPSSSASATGPSSTTSWPTSSASSRRCTPSSAAAT